jgi:hypothetical protein
MGETIKNAAQNCPSPETSSGWDSAAGFVYHFLAGGAFSSLPSAS